MGGTGLSSCGGCLGGDRAVTPRRELAVGSAGGQVQLSPRDGCGAAGCPPQPGHSAAGVGDAVPLTQEGACPCLSPTLRGSPLARGGTQPQPSPWAPQGAPSSCPWDPARALPLQRGILQRPGEFQKVFKADLAFKQ